MIVYSIVLIPYAICILPVYVRALGCDNAHTCSALVLLLLQVCSGCCRCAQSWMDWPMTDFVFGTLKIEAFQDMFYPCWLIVRYMIYRLTRSKTRDMPWLTQWHWCSCLPSLHLFLDLSASSQDDNGSRGGPDIRKSVNTKGEQYI